MLGSAAGGGASGSPQADDDAAPIAMAASADHGSRGWGNHRRRDELLEDMGTRDTEEASYIVMERQSGARGKLPAALR